MINPLRPIAAAKLPSCRANSLLDVPQSMQFQQFQKAAENVTYYPGALVNQPGVDLYKRGARGDLFPRIGCSENSPYSDDREFPSALFVQMPNDFSAPRLEGQATQSAQLV